MPWAWRGCVGTAGTVTEQAGTILPSVAVPPLRQHLLGALNVPGTGQGNMGEFNSILTGWGSQSGERDRITLSS